MSGGNRDSFPSSLGRKQGIAKEPRGNAQIVGDAHQLLSRASRAALKLRSCFLRSLYTSRLLCWSCRPTSDARPRHLRPRVSPERGPAGGTPQCGDTPVHQCGDGGGRALCPFRWAAPAPHHRQAPTARHAALPPVGEGKGMTQPRPTRRRGRRFRWETTARALADGGAPSSPTALRTRGLQLRARPTGARGSWPRGPATHGETVGGRVGGGGGSPTRGCPASVERPRLNAGPRRWCRPKAVAGAGRIGSARAGCGASAAHPAKSLRAGAGASHCLAMSAPPPRPPCAGIPAAHRDNRTNPRAGYRTPARRARTHTPHRKAGTNGGRHCATRGRG